MGKRDEKALGCREVRKAVREHRVVWSISDKREGVGEMKVEERAGKVESQGGGRGRGGRRRKRGRGGRIEDRIGSHISMVAESSESCLRPLWRAWKLMRTWMYAKNSLRGSRHL